MDFLNAVELLERIALIARLTSAVECRHSEREVAVIWISELADQAIEKLGSADVGLTKKTDIYH